MHYRVKGAFAINAVNYLHVPAKRDHTHNNDQYHGQKPCRSREAERQKISGVLRKLCTAARDHPARPPAQIFLRTSCRQAHPPVEAAAQIAGLLVIQL